MEIKTEQPLVEWKDIAAFLKVSEKVAQDVIREYNVPLLKFGRRVAVYPSTLKKYLERAQQIPNNVF